MKDLNDLRVLVAVPCFDRAPVQFIECLLALEKVGQTDVKFESSSLIFDARNKLAMYAVNNHYDFVLWLDSDMIFEPTLLKDLLAMQKDYAAALFFSRRTDFKPAFFSECESRKGEHGEILPHAKHYFDYPTDAPFEVAATGFGAVLTSVEMLDLIFTLCGLPFIPMPGFGEDLSFGIRVRALEYKIWVNPAIKVGHLGSMIVTEELSKATRARGAQANAEQD